MSKYVWVAAAMLVALSAAILFWIDRAGDEPAAPSLPPGPQRRWLALDGGEEHPHPDRAGLRRRLTK